MADRQATMAGLLNGLQKIRDDAPDVTISILVTFLGIGEASDNRPKENPLSIRELEKRIGLPYSTISRHIRYLGDWQRPQVLRGLGWVETDILPEDRRQKVMFLTPKGKRVFDAFKSAAGINR